MFVANDKETGARVKGLKEVWHSGAQRVRVNLVAAPRGFRRKGSSSFLLFAYSK